MEPHLPRASHGGLLHEDAEKQQCLVVLLHAVPLDFAHDQLPKLREWLRGVLPQQLLEVIETKFFIGRFNDEGRFLVTGDPRDWTWIAKGSIPNQVEGRNHWDV